MNKPAFQNSITPGPISIAMLLWIFLASSGCSFNNQESKPNPEIIQQLDAALAESLEQSRAPGIVVSLSSEQSGNWVRNVGVADIENAVPITDDMHLRIGSVTKTLTTQVILMLQDKGLLNLNDTVDMYFSGIPNGDTITIRSLGNMTSGLANYSFDLGFQNELFSNPERSWVPQEMVDIGIENTKKGCPNVTAACFDMGASWFYSNTNTVILGQIIEQVTDKSYGAVLKEMVLDPLGLENTVHPSNALLPEPFSHGYTLQGSANDQQQDATFWNPGWGFAVGDVISTLADLRIWAEALGTGELLSDKTKAERFTTVGLPPLSPNNNYAFGIGFLDGWWGHIGTIPGYNTLVYYQPDLQASLVILVNTDQDATVNGTVISPVKLLAGKIMAILAQEAPTDVIME